MLLRRYKKTSSFARRADGRNFPPCLCPFFFPVSRTLRWANCLVSQLFINLELPLPSRFLSASKDQNARAFVARRGFSRRPESIKGSFDGTLPRMSALCGVYSRITIVKYGVAGTGAGRRGGGGQRRTGEHWAMFAIAVYAVIGRARTV